MDEPHPTAIRYEGDPPLNPMDALRELVSTVADVTLDANGVAVRVVEDYDVRITLTDPATGATVGSMRVRDGAGGRWHGQNRIAAGRVFVQQTDETLAETIAARALELLTQNLRGFDPPAGNGIEPTRPPAE